MMRKYIIVSHKRFAEGLKSTLDFFTRMGDKITAISAYEHGKNNFPEEELRQAIAAISVLGITVIGGIISSTITFKVAPVATTEGQPSVSQEDMEDE